MNEKERYVKQVDEKIQTEKKEIWRMKEAMKRQKSFEETVAQAQQKIKEQQKKAEEGTRKFHHLPFPRNFFYHVKQIADCKTCCFSSLLWHSEILFVHKSGGFA